MFELARDLALDVSGIKVGVKDRIVTLSGWAPDYAQKLATERAAERVAGCRAIALELSNDPPPDPDHPDAYLATAIMGALRWQTSLSPNRGARGGRTSLRDPHRRSGPVLSAQRRGERREPHARPGGRG
ncbi:BON domain-containing protein [Paraburkholderia sp. A1RO-5]|uniref:BON domain-containing protein n=1 Tax=unclassified Paraburkholderia TaxID=2615204 RepID=UPI003B77215D